jgi:rubrerythrin
MELSQKSRDNLERVLALKAGNCAFYRAAAKVADTEEGQAQFEALTAVDEVQARLVGRMLAVSPPEELTGTGDCSPSHRDNLGEAVRRQKRSAILLSRFAEEAVENRVREVLEAFAAAEQDHQTLGEA